VRLLVFGPGYAAKGVIDRLRSRARRISATARSPERAAALTEANIEPVAFDGAGPSRKVVAALEEATHVLVSIPPGEAGDAVVNDHAEDIAAAPALRSIVYLSTVGVYGDHGGAWVDEATPPRPVSARSIARLKAELTWRNLAGGSGKPLAVLRLAGIYGPGRNALASLADGSARRLVKPGQVFNRIHVEDIASAVVAAFDREADGIFNVADDEPAPPQDVVAFAAALMGIDPPPETPFDQAELSPMARSFYGENKRVKNHLMKEALGIALAYPTYREGLAALFNRGEGGGRLAG
jgi:nucleoside-diphosphate-sugar epimerase